MLDKSDIPGSDGDATIRDRLKRLFGVDSEFVRVEQLAEMIGISANTVRCQMKTGAFPMPHRRVGNVIVVKVDDFIAWHRGVIPPKPTATPIDAVLPACEPGDVEDQPEPLFETQKERSQRIALDIKRQMRRRP